LSTVYGPVPSWRFGRSLGIDVIKSPKKCTFNCIYCQLGRTVSHVASPEEMDISHVSVSDIISDLDEVIERIDLNTVDQITFSGTGEPTLNPEIGKIAREVKKRIHGIPLAILTNSSLFHREKVREKLQMFDVIVAKLDAGDDETLRFINRPESKTLNIKTIIRSIKKLKRSFNGILSLEVMLLATKNGEKGNVRGKPLKNLLDSIISVEPDLVQLEIPYRPTSESFVLQPSSETVKSISQKLGKRLGENKIWVYGIHDRRGRKVGWFEHRSLENDALDLLKRRPCRVQDISDSLGISSSDAKRLIKGLDEKNLINTKKIKGEQYYQHHYPQEK
jgi:wyosine [tRNA(Phe)-imidazoG37] synthetase (radical SAM superfamily)